VKKERKTSLPALALATAVTVAGVVGGVPAPSCLFHGKGVVEKAWADAKQVIGASARYKWTEPTHFTIFSLRSVPYREKGRADHGEKDSSHGPWVTGPVGTPWSCG